MGVARAGQALLRGLLICGQCGLRMVAQYNNNGATPRYACMRMACDYGEPICQTLKAAPLDELIVHLVLAALNPAALKASLLVAGDLERERALFRDNFFDGHLRFGEEPLSRIAAPLCRCAHPQMSRASSRSRLSLK